MSPQFLSGTSNTQHSSLERINTNAGNENQMQLLGNASGEVKVTYTPLITPEEVDQAAEKGRQMPDAYRAPGQ
jgi:hypothetical protein